MISCFAVNADNTRLNNSSEHGSVTAQKRYRDRLKIFFFDADADLDARLDAGLDA
jgi:hypothetical protein